MKFGFGRVMGEKQMIRALERRLQWLMNEADEDEFDSSEVTAIVDLLQVMDPIEKRVGDFFVEPKANGRFWTFYAFRGRYDNEKPPYDNFLNRFKLRVKRIVNGVAFARVSFAVMLLVAIVFGGTLVVFAQKEGYFHWLNDDENIVAAITTSNQDTDSTEQLYYKSVDDVPIKYLKYVWIPNYLPADYELKDIRIYNDSKSVTAECLLRADEIKFIKFMRKDFGDIPTVTSQTYDSFEHIDTQTVCNVEATYLKKVNDDYTEYMVSFSIENAIYFVHSNEEMKDIIPIVNNCIEEILK